MSPSDLPARRWVAFALLGLQGVSEIIKRIAFLKGLLPATEFEKKGHAT